MDKRIIKTRRILGDTLIQLLQEQAFYQITIRQITERAGVAYSTFFRNFDSVEALLHAHLEDFMQDIKTLNTASPDDSFRDTTRKNVDALFEHVANNPTMYRVLLSTSVVRPMLGEFKQDLIAQQMSLVQSLALQLRDDTPPIQLVVYSAVAQLFTMIEWWLAQDQPIDANTMSTYYEQLLTFPTWRFLLGNQAAHDLLGIPLPS